MDLIGEHAASTAGAASMIALASSRLPANTAQAAELAVIGCRAHDGQDSVEVQLHVALAVPVDDRVDVGGAAVGAWMQDHRRVWPGGLPMAAYCGDRGYRTTARQLLPGPGHRAGASGPARRRTASRGRVP